MQHACGPDSEEMMDLLSITSAEPPLTPAPYRTVGVLVVPFHYTYYHLDHLASPRIITDSAGVRVQGQHFLPFGEEMPVEDGTNTRKFTGHERDAETGLDYMLARYYEAPLGRFMSPDPATPNVRLRTPQTWNRYGYTDNNPIDAFDPDGLASVRRRPLNFFGVPVGPYEIAPTAYHAQIFFDDGSADIGFFKDGLHADDKELIDRYETVLLNLNDEKMHQAVENVKASGCGRYSVSKNNCQDFVAKVLAEYIRLLREERKRCGPDGCADKPGQPKKPGKPEKPKKPANPKQPGKSAFEELWGDRRD